MIHISSVIVWLVRQTEVVTITAHFTQSGPCQKGQAFDDVLNPPSLTCHVMSTYVYSPFQFAFAISFPPSAAISVHLNTMPLSTYRRLTCEDESIAVVIIPESLHAREFVSTLGDGQLAHRVLITDPSVLEIISESFDHNQLSQNPGGPKQPPRFTEPVIALRLSQETWTFGSGTECDVILPSSHVAPKAFQICAPHNQPYLTIKGFDGDVFMNERALNPNHSELSGDTTISMTDVVFTVIPIRDNLVQKCYTENNSPEDPPKDYSIHWPLFTDLSVKTQLGPQCLGHFRSGELLAEGTQGEVYKYNCPTSGELLAVKVIEFSKHPDGFEKYKNIEPRMSQIPKHVRTPSYQIHWLSNVS